MPSTILENAAKKLAAKNADYIIANSIAEKGAGFAGDTNHVILLSQDGKYDIGMRSKEETAAEILKHCLKGRS